MNQVAGNQMRLYDLPSKLLCRVINVELKVPAYPLPRFARFSCSIPLRLRKIVSYLFVCWEIRFGQLICLADFWQAEADTDEVYAQVMLMPEPEVSSTVNFAEFTLGGFSSSSA